MTETKDRVSHLQSVAYSADDRHGLVASDGTPLPGHPRVGFKLKVKWGPHYWQFSGWRVVTVNSQSFYVWGEGWKQRFLLEEWENFLAERLEAGEVTVVADAPPPKLKVVR